MNSRNNPYRDLSSTLRLDTVLYRVTRTSKAPVIKQSQATKLDELSVFQHVNVNVNLTNPFVLPQGYKNALVINSPFSFKVVMTQGDSTIELDCTGSYSTVGSFDGQVSIFGLTEEFTRCSVVSA